MCDLIHTWEKVRRRGGFLKFRYARSPVSRSIGRRLFAHALRDLSAASTTESLSRSGAMASRCAVVSPSRNYAPSRADFPQFGRYRPRTLDVSALNGGWRDAVGYGPIPATAATN